MKTKFLSPIVMLALVFAMSGGAPVPVEAQDPICLAFTEIRDKACRAAGEALDQFRDGEITKARYEQLDDRCIAMEKAMATCPDVE